MSKKNGDSIRGYAKAVGFEIVGKLRRIPDVHYGICDYHYPVWIDEAGNKFCGSYNTGGCYCIITADGRII